MQDWQSHEQGLFIEFNGKSFLRAQVNGHELRGEELEALWRDNKLFLPARLLKSGAPNELEFLVSNRFNNDQFGFVRAQDPDGDEYSFIQTVPYYASRITPLFDQPDLKGEFRIAVVHNKSDICITSGPLLGQCKPADRQELEKLDAWAAQRIQLLDLGTADCLVSCFENTPRLSTYLLNLVCGPLHQLQATEAQTYKDIKMNIYCRSTLDSPQSPCASSPKARRTTSSSSKN